MTQTLETQTVTALLHAVRDRDVEGVLARLDPNIVWHNVGLPKVLGIARVEKFVRMLAQPPYGFDVVVHNIAADGDIVLTERTDVLIWRRLRIEFWVCGTFELRDGKVAVWRDYFDNLDFAKGLVRALFRAI